MNLQGEITTSDRPPHAHTGQTFSRVTVSMDMLTPYAFSAMMDLLAKANDIGTRPMQAEDQPF